jgi:hypothetical protein
MPRSVIVFVAMLLPAACTVGRDNVIFVTRTNVAIDLDTAPPTTEIGFNRYEAVLSPVDANGNVLPVLTSVGVKEGPLNFGANHSFATGNAAIVMSEYLGKRTDLGADESIERSDGGVAVIDPAKLRRPLPGNSIADEGRVGYVFATTTTLGLAVSWDAGYTPTAVALGYKRKELAVVPLRRAPPDDASGAAPAADAKLWTLASLIATVDSGATVGSQSGTGVVLGQTFATGQAATFLASHPAIRAALAPTMIPNYDEVARQLEARADAVNAPRDAQQASCDAVKTWWRGDGHPPADEQRTAVRKKATELGLVPEGTDDAGFLKALQTASHKGDAANAKAFEDLVKSLPK